MAGRKAVTGRSWAHRAAPFIVLGASLFATAAASNYIQRTARAEDRARFGEAVTTTTMAVQRRVDAYVALLRATAGMLSSPDAVSASRFRAFVGRLQLREAYPGTLGVGYAVGVETPQLDEFESRIRAEATPGFDVWPVSDGVMYPIKYIEPLDERNRRALGFNMFSDPIRRAAMERARDAGTPAASGRVRLVQESGPDEQAGFLIYVPIYRGHDVPQTLLQRRETISGFAYAPLRLGDLLTAIYDDPDPDVAFQIFDGDERRTPETFLFDSDPVVGPPPRSGLEQTVRVPIAGHPWTFTFAPRPAFLAASDLRLVPYVTVTGILMSLVFFGITVALSRALGAERRSAAALAASRDELRGVAERFRVALKNAPILVYNSDLDLRYTWIVNAPAQFLPEEIIGKRDDEIVPAEDAAELIELKSRVVRTGVGLRREIQVRLRGEQRYFDLTIEPLRNAQGVMHGLTVAAIDTTNLRKAYEQYRLASLAVRSLIYDLDVRTGTIDWSEGLAEVLGFYPEQAGRERDWWEERVHPEDAGAYRRVYEGLGDEDRFVVEYRVRHRDGHWVDVLDSGLVVRDEQNRPVRVVGNALNISDRKAAARALARHAEELSRSNADLQDFAYIASHDLKEPLRGIANYAKFLDEDQGPQLGPEGRERVETIRRLAQHMYGLLDSLLEYSRVGRTELAVVEVDLAEIVDDVVTQLEPWLEQENGKVRVVGDLPIVRADRVRVGQVFGNLITNAVKYNDSSPRLVEVGAVEGESPPVLYVRDNGIGIPERHQNKLFHMFKRLHPRTHYGGGTGSGLAIAKKIVDRHGGEIWLESEPGKGTTFYFRLQPADASSPTQDRMAVEAGPTPAC